jgi:hypothetical protein
MKKRANRRNKSAKLALKAKEKANEVIHKIQGLTNSNGKFFISFIIFIKISKSNPLTFNFFYSTRKTK